MKKLYTRSLLLCCTGIFFLSFWGQAAWDDKYEKMLKSTGAHESSTGAPGEKTCTQSGCHDKSFVMPGDSVNSLLFGQPGAQNYGDDTVAMKITVRHEGTEKFGFQIVCLDSNKKNAGTFVVFDGKRIQRQGADPLLPATLGRRYLTHTYYGNKPEITGEISWEFSWIPPQNGYRGAVTFYLMSNCANNDNTSEGDLFYSSSYRFTYAPASSVHSDIDGHSQLNVQSDGKNIFLNMPARQMLEYKLYDLQGNLAANGLIHQGSTMLDIYQALKPGIYAVNILGQNGLSLHKSLQSIDLW
jgi:hypothetical protein